MRCVCRCRCTCTLAHQKTALPSEGWRAGRGCCEFICHMPREHWNRSTVIHSSGLQRDCLPFSLIHSPIYTSDTALLHLASLVDIKTAAIIHPDASQQRKALLLVVQRKRITASSGAENLRAEWKMKLPSQTQLTG